MPRPPRATLATPKEFNIKQVMPAEGRDIQTEIKRLRDGIKNSKTETLEVMDVKIIKSSDPRYNSPDALEACAQEMVWLIEQGPLR